MRVQGSISCFSFLTPGKSSKIFLPLRRSGSYCHFCLSLSARLVEKKRKQMIFQLNFLQGQLLLCLVLVVLSALAGLAFREIDQCAWKTCRWTKRRWKRRKRSVLMETTLPVNVVDGMADVLLATPTSQQELQDEDSWKRFKKFIPIIKHGRPQGDFLV